MRWSLNAPIKDWSGKRVWIVGASSGIGAALAEGLLQAGAQVTLSARRQDELEKIAGSHARASVVAFDVTDTQAWPGALSRTVEQMGFIDLVVLGAARYDPCHSWDFDMDQVEKSFDLNVVSLYRGLHLIVPHLLAQGSGGVAMIASISAYTGLPRALVYGATKAALNHLAEILYFELAPKGLAIYLINPGFVSTPMTSVNEFAMPGLMTPSEAASAIMTGFEKGRFEIRFPRGVAGLLRWMSRLPYRWRFPLLHKVTGV